MIMLNDLSVTIHAQSHSYVNIEGKHLQRHKSLQAFIEIKIHGRSCSVLSLLFTLQHIATH